ncbi:serine protease [Aquibium sp. A9E412]|uniref:trypsin-like serine peptidase n=1 Tax=Aquibium sp. A9E412 TaxID=2976767 RepID=UPI0025B0578F|nr:serine protease [Aquibium sp. A9E412]MDN2565922.1 serine protease [Aquibium sp. A9E412]
MKSIERKCLLPALLAAALAAGPAWAQSTSGSAGSGETPRAAMPGGELKTEGAAPIEPLEIEEDAVTRDLELDPGKLEEDLTTVKRARGGEVTREAASGRLKRALSGAEGGDPAFDMQEEDRQVFGDDDRVQIRDTSPYPFRVFGLLQGENADGGLGNCSATLIGPRTLLTAAHCLYSHENGGWLDNFVFAPGLNGMNDAPFGVFEYEAAYIFEGYLSNYQGYYGSVVPWDIAVVHLQEPVGDWLGWLAVGYDDNLGDFYANIVGYPGDKPGGTMWRSNCDVSRQNMAELYFQYLCDTYPGSSGSSVYKYTAATQERIVYGVNVAESPQANTAVRINRVYFEWIVSLLK